MRIAIVCTYYPYPPSAGGVETIVRQTAEELAKRGHEIHIITSTYDVTTQKPVTTSGIEEKNNIIVHKLRSKPIGIGYARILLGLRNEIERIKPDIVHVHNLHPSLFQLAKWRKKLGYKLIVELHHPAACAEKMSTKIMLPLAMLILVKCSKYVDAFIAHTLLEVQWLKKWRIGSNKIVLIGFPAIPDSLLNYTTISAQRENTILFIGRIVERKGIDVLLEAYKQIAKKIDSRLIIAGPGNTRTLQKIKKQVEKYALKQHVSILGYISEGEKIRIIASSKILTLPSYREYTPVVLLEAQALGTPVVASKVGAIPEIVKDEETGILIEPGNVDRLAKALETLLTNGELWKNMSLRAREWAKKFTLSRAVSKLEKLYNNVFMSR